MKKYLRIIIILVYAGIMLSLYVPIYENSEIQFYSCQKINCSNVLVELLNKYPNHVCAFYDLKDNIIEKSINQGVLFEKNYYSNNSKIVPIHSKGLMHNKFCVFDESYVLTGSWNPTFRGTNLNDNYILLIDSAVLAKKYLEEYNHLLDRKQQVSPISVWSPESSVSLYFCPQHNCQKQVISILAKAQSSVKILAFTFTDQKIAEQLLAISRKGVDVEIIFEKTRITRYSVIDLFEQSSVITYLDANSYTMHEKMFIIDEETLILGSYNPTISATQKNDENILIINDGELAKTVLNEYLRVRSSIIV